jgi:hypothetical protein
MATKIGFANELSVSSSQITDFYKIHWQRKIALSDKKFHVWQFENAVENRGANSCVVALNDDRLVGVMGLNKRIFYSADQRLNGAELTTWAVDKQVKGSGAGAKILNFITDNFTVLFGTGISQDALPIYLRSGFHYLRYIPRYIHVIDAKKILEISNCATYALKLVKNASAEASGVKWEEISWKNQPHAPFVEGNHFSRGLENLIWRYESHPYFKYKSYRTMGLDGEVGYVVLRGEITYDIRILHVIDILGPETSFKSSIKFIESYAQENGFWAVDVYSTLSRLNKYFSHRMWLSAVDSSFVNVPHLFHPLEVRNPATTSLIYWSKNSNVDFLDVSRLYLTKQDCDLDRPTMNFIGCHDE